MDEMRVLHQTNHHTQKLLGEGEDKVKVWLIKYRFGLTQKQPEMVRKMEK